MTITLHIIGDNEHQQINEITCNSFRESGDWLRYVK
jgi:hypothetical protein